ncbi:MAG: hypothetical protein QM529_07015 [Hydrotalea sp.]|nr:hypothetical protein [Hydrotalea sp.]
MLARSSFINSVFVKRIAKSYHKISHRVTAPLRAIDKEIKKNILCNIGLLYLWVIIFGLFSTDYSDNLAINLWQSIIYLFSNRDGFLCNIAYLAPLLTQHKNAGGRIRLLLFLPLIDNFFHYSFFARDYFHFWGFWLSAIISFYAALNIARFYYQPASKKFSAVISAWHKCDAAIANYFYRPLGKLLAKLLPK